ncbi:MAG: TonB-dependent receptor [Pseudomonadales bacterium]
MKQFQLLPLCIAVATCAPFVQAQNESGIQLEEVIVSARMREESLQDVPLSITPFSMEDIERRDLVNLEDIASNTVGMSYLGASTSGYQSAPTIRGLSTGFLQDRVQNVGVFLNGIYLQRQSMMNMGMVDMERMEIVKGPQNSLYGHSAFAGAINYVTAKPQEEFSGYLHTTQGDNEREDYRISLGGPIIGDSLLGRITLGSSDYDGHTDNEHPLNDADPAGYNNQGRLGGWEDESWNVGLRWLANDSLSVDLGYYGTRLQRENQPHYVLGGLREVAVIQVSRYDDMNSNTVSLFNSDTGAEYVGNTMWDGALPTTPSEGTCINEIPFAYPCPAVDQRSSGVVVDPRAYGFVADTDIVTFGFDWDINDTLSLSYLYGQVKHEGSTAGPAERDPLGGATLLDPTFVPYPQIFEVFSNISSARPITELEQSSHELRLDLIPTDNISASIGVYFSKVEDEQHDQTFFAPVCSDRDVNGSGSNEDEIAACSIAYTDSLDVSPLNDINYNPFWLFAGQKWNGEPGNWTKFEDNTRALFLTVDWSFTDRLNLRFEGRYNHDEREIQRLTDGFGLEPGERGIIFGGSFPFPYSSTIQKEFDSDTFTYFAPRLGLDFHLNEQSFLYGYVAKGVKAGGFNNAADESQQTYDDETNVTFEIGSKNLFLDAKLMVNVSAYYIDWENIQGSEPAKNADSINSSSVVGNIGDAESMGVELEMKWLATENLSFDFGLALNSAEYKSGTEYDPAQRHFYYNCDRQVVTGGGESGDENVCGDTSVGGNSLPRNPENQVMAAINYSYPFNGGWTLDARLDGNYQSKQYITPLNSAYIEGRTLANANVMLSSQEHWEISLWVKNLLDKEYVGGVLAIAEQNKLIVALGAPRSVGLGVRFKF